MGIECFPQLGHRRTVVLTRGLFPGDDGAQAGELGPQAVERLLPCFADDGRLTPCETARERLRSQIEAIDRSMATMRETRAMLVAALGRPDERADLHEELAKFD
ncbi:hypothetical protein [Kitasatospora sp. GP82]|uniref:hypothetical protein n=1 Tax=Kitasatospora sp. GP82 TaxID=3035089 RepID=UPI002476FB72|nr:hypothetical protein [Kitasatospora sp. GP82]